METNLLQDKDYKVFVGGYTTQMPLLVKQGFTPLTAKDVMEYQIKAIQSKDKQVCEYAFWLTHGWNTVDGLAYFKDNLIVVPNSQELLNINLNSKLSHRDYKTSEMFGELVLTQEQYDPLAKKYDVLKRSKMIINERLTKKQAKQHQIWLRLAQGDKALLNEYVDAIFTKAKKPYSDFNGGYPYGASCAQYIGENRKMEISLPLTFDGPHMTNWVLCELTGNLGLGAQIIGFFEKDKDCVLLGTRAKNLEELVIQ